MNTVCKIISIHRKDSLGYRFKTVRLQKGLSIEELALHACIEPLSLIVQFEEGEIGLPLDRIYAIANVLEISPRLVLQWIDQETPNIF